MFWWRRKPTREWQHKLLSHHTGKLYTVCKMSENWEKCKYVIFLFERWLKQLMFQLSLSFFKIYKAGKNIYVWKHWSRCEVNRYTDRIMHMMHTHHVPYFPPPSLSFSLLIKPHRCHRRQRGWLTAKQQELLYCWWAVKCSGTVSNRAPSAAKTRHHPEESAVGGANSWHTGVWGD